MKHLLDLHAGRRHRFAARSRRQSGFRARARLSRGEFVTIILAGIFGGLVWVKLPDAPFLDRIAPAALVPDRGTSATPGARVSFGLCRRGGGTDCVVDGDTFRIGGEKVRITDIDTPETHPARCPHEAALGAAATRRLRELLNGGAVTLAPIARDADRYGRKLRIVRVDGVGVGETLVSEGLARAYQGNRRASWCD